MRNFLFFIILTLNWFITAQKLPTIKPEELKSKGKNKIYYSLKNGYKYIPNTKIIDWYASLEKIQISEEYDSKKMYFVESAKYLDGQKNGEFEISLLSLKNKETSLGTIYWLAESEAVMSGNYTNNFLNGTVAMLTFIDFKSQTGILNLQYQNGKLTNQTVTYPYPILCERSPYSDVKLVLVPSVKFENGTVKELNHIEKDEFPYKKVFNADQIITMRYTHDPLCFNSFSFKTNSYLKDVMNLNVNKFGIEVFTEKLDMGKTYLEGSYRLFLPMGNSKTFDTTKLVANYKYLNGQRNGLAQIWYETDNGLNGDNPTIEQNYKNDLLHGESRLFFSDGKVALQANFINGYLCGETKTFANGPNFKVYSLDGISRRSTDGLGGVLLVYHINESHKFSNELNESINLIKEKKGKISENTGYKLFSKANYVIDSTTTSNGNIVKYSKVKDYVSIYNNEFEIVKKYFDKNDPSKPTEILYIDETGKQVYSLTQAISEVNAASKVLQKEADKVNNQIVICHYCNTQVKLGNSVSNGDCDCFTVKNNGVKEKISIYVREIWPFCSRKCLTDWEKQTCKKNGYTWE